VCSITLASTCYVNKTFQFIFSQYLHLTLPRRWIYHFTRV